MQDFPEIMGMGDVMRYIKVSRQYVDRLVEQGKLRCKQTSTGKVFLFSDIAAFQKQRQLKANKRKAK